MKNKEDKIKGGKRLNVDKFIKDVKKIKKTLSIFNPKLK